MARLIFVSEGERNNDERGETSSLSKATNNDYETNDKSENVDDKNFHQRQSSSSPHSYLPSEDNALSTSIIGESMVARLASKFDTNDTAVVPKSSSSSPATAETNACNSSVLETIKFFEKQSSSKKQRSSSVKRAMATATRNHSSPRFKTIDIVKPSVGPKPTIVNAAKQTKSSIKQVSDTRVQKSGSLHYHVPTLSVTRKENNVTEYLLSASKNKRLSIAKDFSLESVLNGGVNENECDIITKHTRNELESQLETAEKTANASFLHKYLQQCVESKKTAAAAEVVGSSTDDSSDIYSTVNEYESSLHDRLFNESKSNDDENGVYEDVPGSTDEKTNGVDHHQYAVIKTDNNIYDEVIYSNLHNRHEEDECENYEIISSGVYEDHSKENLPPTDSAIRSSDSDSSMERTNSLYELKPNSNLSSATTSTFSSSNDCINIKIESPYMFVGEKSSCSDVSDDAITDDWDSDEDENRREIIVYTKWLHLSRLRKLKLLLRSKGNTRPPAEVKNCCIDDLCDDFDDSSSESETDYQLNKSQSIRNGQTQSIYGLVERARKSVLKSWSSLNHIRKLSAVNSSNNVPVKSQDDISSPQSKSVSAEEINAKNGHSTVNSSSSARWLPFKDKSPKHSTSNNSSSSIFYLNPEDICFNGGESTLRSEKNINANDRQMRTTIKLQPIRPTSPPPPPPPLSFDKQKSNELKSTDTSISNIDSDRSSSSYESRNSSNGSEAIFDLNCGRSESDLQILRFADEPLYQFYAESVAKLTTSTSIGCFTDSDGYEEIASNASRPSAMELITPSPNGHGQYRSLWCEVDEVKNSGILETLNPSKQRLQEAIFEIITSEASYYKSLSVLDKIFVSNAELKNESVLKKNDWKVLFGNVAAVRKCSEKLLAALEKCWQDSILLTGLCDVIYQHASENFRIYVKYCSNQIYIDRTLKSLNRERNSRFVEIVSQLEANSMCQSLSLHSFLMLPMQRITRMPLLLDAVLSRMNSIANATEYKTYQITLATINEIVNECNETARKLERYEEMLLLSGQLEFSKKDVKMFSVASSSRWLIRSGPMVHINPQDIKLTITRRFTKQTTKYYFFLFNDILVVAKKKSEDTYVVFDYCARNMLQMSPLEDDNISPYKYLLLLIMLENHEGKTVEMIVNCDSDSTRQRWIEATSSYLTSDNPEEKLYEEWDCPQVSAIHSYTAIQPDELSLQAGDVVKVSKKTSDGWYHGERIRDGVTGWFPGNYTVEIASQHMRAKNLKLRHRLLTLSGNYLQFQLQKKN